MSLPLRTSTSFSAWEFIASSLTDYAKTLPVPSTLAQPASTPELGDPGYDVNESSEVKSISWIDLSVDHEYFMADVDTPKSVIFPPAPPPSPTSSTCEFMEDEIIVDDVIDDEIFRTPIQPSPPVFWLGQA